MLLIWKQVSLSLYIYIYINMYVIMHIHIESMRVEIARTDRTEGGLPTQIVPFDVAGADIPPRTAVYVML